MKNKHITILRILAVICLSAILTPVATSASPVINGVSFVPSADLWLGEDLTMVVNCTESENFSITNVKTQIAGENGYTIPNKTFRDIGGGLYEAIIEALYMNEPNSFSVNISCVNNVSIETIQTSSFTVSNLSAKIVSSTPVFSYLDEQIEIDVKATRNGVAISSGVNFSIKIDGKNVNPKIDPPYDPVKGWILYIDPPTVSGIYNLEISVLYGRADYTIATKLTVENHIKFSIMSIDKTLIKVGDEINVDIEAFDKGNKITLKEDNFGIDIGEKAASILSITPVSDYFRVKVEVPSLEAGEQTLSTALTYGNNTYSDSEVIDYAVVISGEFLDKSERGVSAEIRFLSNGVEELRLHTKTDGSYEGAIQIGTYDIEFVFPESKLKLEDVYITDFEDPLNYYYSLSDDLTPGLKSAGLFVYETTLKFSKVRIEMEYNDKDVYDENEIKVYKCSNWNAGKKICSGEWKEIGGAVDSVRNTITVDDINLSAYGIGTLKGLSIEFNINKQKFYVKDSIKLRGIVFDKYKNTVDNASVRAYIEDTNIYTAIYSDRNGAFLIEFLSPEQEGNYTLHLSAEKYPYIEFNSSISIEVAKSRDILITLPDTIRVKQGGSLDQELTLANTGQADLDDLNISLTGIPKEYYDLVTFIEKLEVGKEKNILISFSIPENATLSTYSATFKVFNTEVSEEKIFGFTVLETNQTEPSKPSSTGVFTLPKLVLPEGSTLSAYILVIVFASVSFTLAILLKKRKKGSIEINEARANMTTDVLELKNQIANQDQDITEQLTPRNSMPGNPHQSEDVGQEKNIENDNENLQQANLQPSNQENNQELTWGQLKEKWLNGKNSDFGGSN